MTDHADRLRELAELAALIAVPFTVVGAIMLIEWFVRRGTWR